MSFERWERWGPLTGVVSVVLMVIAFAIAGSSPDTSSTRVKPCLGPR